ILISGRRQQSMANVEFRIMPNGEEGRWYWEVIKDGREVVARGVTDTEPAACEGMKRRKSGASCISRKLCRARVLLRRSASLQHPWRVGACNCTRAFTAAR